MYKVGSVGNYRHGLAAMLHPDLDVRAFCDINKERLDRFVRVAEFVRQKMLPVRDVPPIKGYSSYDEMLEKEDLDIVMITTPHDLHAPMALKALYSGRHVFVEKPMCCSLEECEELVAAVRKTGMKLGINQNVRCAAGFHYLFDQQAAGTIGDPYYIHADYISNCSPAGLESPDPSHHNHHDFSVLMPGGSHPVDLILGLMGDEARQVYAQGSKLRTSRAYSHNDMMNVMMAFEGGRTGYSVTTLGCIRHGFFAFELYGTKRDVIQTHPHYPAEGNVGLFVYKDKTEFEEKTTFGENQLPQMIGHGTMNYAQYENLVYAIKHDVKQRTFADVVDGARNISVCVLAEESASTGKPVEVPHWEALTYAGTAPLWDLKDYAREIHVEYGRYLNKTTLRRVAAGEDVA